MILAIFFYLGLVLGSGFLVLVGIQTVSDGFERHEERTAILDRPVSSLSAVAFGETALVGTARADGRPERVPFGGQDRALFYDVTVDDTNKLETPHVDERVARSFFLEPDADAADADGHVRVDASGFRLDLSDDRRWSTEIASHEAISDDLEAFAEAKDVPAQGLERDREFAYEYLAPGDDVFVYGRAVPDDRAGGDGKGVLVTVPEGGAGVISDKSPETLLAERRRVLAKSVLLGVLECVVGLAVFLWLTGIAQFLLGA
ncbi:hypothetical protein ACERIM_04560 [Natrinema sp. H-ect1]|uniref:hypothetical protein n=1 Tax=Natrinema sp. H-ect1 TaxID=3242700 RepID=UPI00359E7195